METCQKCSQPTICGHSISLDGSRGLWRLCCLCTAELIGMLNGTATDGENARATGS